MIDNSVSDAIPSLVLTFHQWIESKQTQKERRVKMEWQWIDLIFACIIRRCYTWAMPPFFNTIIHLLLLLLDRTSMFIHRWMSLFSLIQSKSRISLHATFLSQQSKKLNIRLCSFSGSFYFIFMNKSECAVIHGLTALTEPHTHRHIRTHCVYNIHIHIILYIIRWKKGKFLLLQNTQKWDF